MRVDLANSRSAGATLRKPTSRERLQVAGRGQNLLQLQLQDLRVRLHSLRPLTSLSRGTPRAFGLLRPVGLDRAHMPSLTPDGKTKSAQLSAPNMDTTCCQDISAKTEVETRCSSAIRFSLVRVEVNLPLSLCGERAAFSDACIERTAKRQKKKKGPPPVASPLFPFSVQNDDCL